MRNSNNNCVNIETIFIKSVNFNANRTKLMFNYCIINYKNFMQLSSNKHEACSSIQLFEIDFVTS